MSDLGCILHQAWHESFQSPERVAAMLEEAGITAWTPEWADLLLVEDYKIPETPKRPPTKAGTETRSWQDPGAPFESPASASMAAPGSRDSPRFGSWAARQHLWHGSINLRLI